MEYFAGLLLIIVVHATIVSADWVDLYGGLPSSGHTSLETGPAFAAAPFRGRFDSDVSGLGGVRLRAEPADLPLGFTLDAGYEEAAAPGASLRLLPVTLGATLPSRLTLPGHPTLHPTGMLGVTATSARGHINAPGNDLQIGGSLLPFDNARLGGVAALGLEWRPRPHFALFGEYRYQYLRFNEESGWFWNTGSVDTIGEVHTGGLVFGVSIPIGRPERPLP